jgi:hypothetical protein
MTDRFHITDEQALDIWRSIMLAKANVKMYKERMRTTRVNDPYYYELLADIEKDQAFILRKKSELFGVFPVE